MGTVRVHDVESPLALYRRYRPETFAEVIGQDHVTEPLRAALASNRVNHAYLFSGPRGCGKTTSARILARALNCELAPVADPCGQCQSCRDLARGGPGSIDVIEIDAASHGGVDDARDLREKAFRAWIARGEGGGATDNGAIIAETVALRAERARLLGYPSFAHFRLDDSMAKTPQAVRGLLEREFPQENTP